MRDCVQEVLMKTFEDSFLSISLMKFGESGSSIGSELRTKSRNKLSGLGKNAQIELS